MTTVVIDEVTDQQLANYAALVYETTGIRLSPQKKALLSNRIRRRLRVTGIDGFDAYYRHLRKLPSGDAEWDAFLQEITTHETFLFRDAVHWNWLREEFLPEMNTEARAGRRNRRLRIWSAACSTGDEAYTIAACIADRLPLAPQWSVEIVGTDIGLDAVEQARHPVFNARAMNLVSPDYRRRFFTSVTTGTWTPQPALQKWTRFQQHNLLNPLREAPFDLVVLKNVLIYFDRDSKRRVLANLLRVLSPGGYLLNGAAEGINDLLQEHALQRVNSWLHRAPLPRDAR